MAKKPKYPMQTLYEMREKAKDEAEEFYAARQRDVSAAENTLNDMKNKLRDMIAMRAQRKEEYSQAMRDGKLSVQQIQGNDRHIERLKNEEAAYEVEIVRQVEVVDERRADADAAKEEMLLATQEFKALEKHKEKWWKKVKRELQIKEEEEVEDISQAQYFKRMMEERGQK